MPKQKIERDFRKRKAKVGKKLKKTNETDLSFKTRKLQLLEQRLDFHGMSAIQRIKAHVSHLGHHK